MFVKTKIVHNTLPTPWKIWFKNFSVKFLIKKIHSWLRLSLSDGALALHVWGLGLIRGTETKEATEVCLFILHLFSRRHHEDVLWTRWNHTGEFQLFISHGRAQECMLWIQFFSSFLFVLNKTQLVLSKGQFTEWWGSEWGVFQLPLCTSSTLLPSFICLLLQSLELFFSLKQHFSTFFFLPILPLVSNLLVLLALRKHFYIVEPFCPPRNELRDKLLMRLLYKLFQSRGIK